MDSVINPSIPALANEIRAANHAMEPEILERRAKFIADELERMGPEQETRFEFYVRSHLPYRAVKRILQREVDFTHRDNAEANIASIQGGKESFYNALHRGGKVDKETGAPVITDDMGIVVGGLAKLFIGELVDIAREVMRSRTMFEDAHSGNCDPAVLASFVAESEATAAMGMGMKKGKGASADSSSSSSSAYDDQYTAYQIMPEDIAEAANRMYDDNKLGRTVRVSSHLFSGAYHGGYAGTTLMSSANLLHDVTDVMHAGEVVIEQPLQAGSALSSSSSSSSSSSEVAASMTMSTGEVSVFGDTHETLLAILRSVIRREAGVDEGDSSESEDDDEDNQSVDNKNEESDISRAFFGPADKARLTKITHQHNLDLLQAYQETEACRVAKWREAKQLKADEEARVAAKAAQDAALLLQKEKIAQAAAAQLAHRTASQQAQAEQAVRGQAMAAAVGSGAGSDANPVVATLSPQAQIHAQTLSNASGKRKRG